MRISIAIKLQYVLHIAMASDILFLLKREEDIMATKFCKWCGESIDIDCVVCPKCGKQVEELKQSNQPIVINNTNTNTSVSSSRASASAGGGNGRARNKWVAFFLCLFLGYLGAHKFYEGRVGLGILYLVTLGLFGIGWIIDTISLLFKPNPYYV